MKSILAKHSDIIYMTKYRRPNYKVLTVSEYLRRIYPEKDLFLDNFDSTPIINLLRNKFGNDTSCFLNNGNKKKFELDTIKYYQSEVGLEGPKHSLISDPVHVINYCNMDILYNGYHRTLSHLFNRQFAVNAYYLAI